MNYPVHDAETAPAAARDLLASAKKAYGFVPNLLAVMANAPALLSGYMTLSKIFDESSFTPAERQVILLSVSARNGCEYCVAAHSVIAGMQKVPAAVVESIRNGKPIADARLQALRHFTERLVEQRGWPTVTEIADFLAAGYSQQNILEVVLGVGMKTLSNYMNHIAATPLDQNFSGAVWKKAA